MKTEQGSCNTFVVLPPLTGKGCVIFGKNSDRPAGEVQELIYEPPKQCTAGESLKCTYIEVEQVEKTFGVILSKPSWMWGCEMGANDQGVVIGNEAVWTKVEDYDRKRLALERSSTAEKSIDVISKLLSRYGQGGSCSDSHPDLTYHNSFLIADANEAWVLETAGEHWVAQRITSGYRNISNCLSIETHFEKSSPDVIGYAKANGFWDGEGDFNFAAAYGAGNIQNKSKPSQKYLAGQELLRRYSESNSFNVKDMFAVLRDKESGICSALDSAFPTTASQVSVLSKTRPGCHWFTATPDPTISVFKPFIFTPDVRVSLHTKSPDGMGKPLPLKLAHYKLNGSVVTSYSANLRVTDSFDFKCPSPVYLHTSNVVLVFAYEKSGEKVGGNCPHTLYSLHAAATSNADNKVTSLLQEMERDCLEEVEKFLDDYQEGQSLSEFDELLKDVVETEVKFYK